MSDTLITRDQLQQDLEDLYYNKIKPYLNGEGRTVVIRTGTITKESPSVTFYKLPISYQFMMDIFTSTGINYIAIDTSVDGECTVTYDENDINENETVEVVCRSELTVPSGAHLVDFKVTTLPRRLNYAQGYKLNLDKIVTTAYFSDGVSNSMKSGTIFDPPDGTVLNTLGQNTIRCTFHDFTDTFEVKVAVRNRLTRLPFYMGYGSNAVVLNNEIHLLGGGYYNYSNNDNWYYSQYHYKWNGSQWSWVSTLPYRLTRGKAVVLNNEIHILGSNYDNVAYRNHYKFDGTQWIMVSTLPYNFYDGCAVVYNNEIHILGGYGGYRTHYKWNGTSWVSVSTLPYDFYYSCAVVYNNEIHILGTSLNSGAGRYHYKWNGSQWSWVSTLPYNFYGGSAVYYNTDNDNEIHILGGNNNDGNNANHQGHYAWNGTQWYRKSTLPHVYFHEMYNNAVIWNSGPDEEIVILGGYGYRNTEQQKNCAQYDGSNWINY